MDLLQRSDGRFDRRRWPASAAAPAVSSIAVSRAPRGAAPRSPRARALSPTTSTSRKKMKARCLRRTCAARGPWCGGACASAGDRPGGGAVAAKARCSSSRDGPTPARAHSSTRCSGHRAGDRDGNPGTRGRHRGHGGDRGISHVSLWSIPPGCADSKLTVRRSSAIEVSRKYSRAADSGALLPKNPARGVGSGLSARDEFLAELTRSYRPQSAPPRRTSRRDARTARSLPVSAGVGGGTRRAARPTGRGRVRRRLALGDGSSGRHGARHRSALGARARGRDPFRAARVRPG